MSAPVDFTRMTEETTIDGNLLSMIEEKREEKEDLELELDIVTGQLRRYERMGYASPQSAYMCIPIQESGYGRRSIAHQLACDIDSLRIQLNKSKSVLSQYQREECAMLHEKCQAALAEHRREYERRHGKSPLLLSHADGSGDEDSDYDTID